MFMVDCGQPRVLCYNFDRVYSVCGFNYVINNYNYRRSIRRGESIKYLVSDDVITYIKANNLYQVQCIHARIYCTGFSMLEVTEQALGGIP